MLDGRALSLVKEAAGGGRNRKGGKNKGRDRVVSGIEPGAKALPPAVVPTPPLKALPPVTTPNTGAGNTTKSLPVLKAPGETIIDAEVIPNKPPVTPKPKAGMMSGWKGKALAGAGIAATGIGIGALSNRKKDESE